MRASRVFYGVLVLALLGGVGAAGYWYRSRPVHEGPPPMRTPVSAPVKEPLIRHPIPPPSAPARSARSAPGAVSAPLPHPPLPPLDRSDPALERALVGLVGRARLERRLRLKEIVRRVVVTVDNVPKRRLPLRYLPLRPAPGHLEVRRIGGPTADRYILSVKNYARYTPYVDLLEAVDPKRLAAVYIRFYPLFQQAYRDLGYRYGYFNDRLVQAIGVLLAAPEPSGPVRLVRPSVYYEFADPRLEALPAGQKVLIRMGPENERRVKPWLRAFLRATERR